MKFTRRDLLIWSAGAAAGLVVSPVPWKLLDDTSIWSQNWPWIPQPVHAPIEVKQTLCALCPKSCGLKVRMAAGWPVGIAGSSTHPVSAGALCPLAFAAHQLNWHPQRLRVVKRKGNASSWNEARAAFSKAAGEGPILIIDGFPGRSASSVLEQFAQKKRGTYRVTFVPETRALVPYETWTGAAAQALTYDLQNAQTVVSFGAPLLDGWGIPGNFTRAWSERAAGIADPQLRLIQIEPSLSRTAAKAWQWLPIRAESDAALAAGLARVLLEERLVAAHGPMPTLSLADASYQTGLPADSIRDLARAIVARTPAVAIAPDYSPAIAALNVVLGAVGSRGGILARSKNAQPQAPAEQVISSARAVLIDATVPWDFTPQTDAEIFRFAAWNPGQTNADWLLPAPGFLEDLTDFPTAPTSPIETYAVAPALLKPTVEVHSAAEFLCGLDPELTRVEKLIHSHCAELFRARTGSLCGQQAALVPSFASVQKFEEQLWQGAVWAGDPPKPKVLRCTLKEWPNSPPQTPADDWLSSWGLPVQPPLASKLYQESGLRESVERRMA